MAEAEGSQTDLEDVIKRFETDYAAQKAAEERAKAAGMVAPTPPSVVAPAENVEAAAPPAETAAAAEETPAAPQTYVVQDGDSLSGISEKIYGDAKHWTTIFEHNKDKISDPNVIHAGQELIIP